jgi:hypothetical protein
MSSSSVNQGDAMGKASRQKAERRAAGTTGPSPAVEQRKAKAAAPRFSPGALAVDEKQLEGLLTVMPADRLPYLGMAAWYLAQAPHRNANQCLVASMVLVAALQSFGVQADLVAIEVAIPSAGVSYGSPEPRVVDDMVAGHVGLLAGDTFLDATASQFKEIREDRGVMPVVGRIADEDRVRKHGGVLRFPFGTGETMEYKVHPVGSADEVGIEFLEKNSMVDIAQLVTNLIRGFAWAVGATRGEINTGLPKLNQSIAEALQAASKGQTPQLVDGSVEYR